MNKHDLRVVKTKISLKQALLTLLKDKPLEQIKITEICKVATINRGTFYLHYTEISDVFKEFFLEIMEDLKNSYQAPYQKTVNLTVATLDPHSIRIFHHVKKYEDFYRIVFSENVPIIYYYMLHEQVSANLATSFDQTKVVTPFAVSYEANAILGLVIEWYKHDFLHTVEEMNRHLVNILRISRHEANSI